MSQTLGCQFWSRRGYRWWVCTRDFSLRTVQSRGLALALMRRWRAGAVIFLVAAAQLLAETRGQSFPRPSNASDSEHRVADNDPGGPGADGDSLLRALALETLRLASTPSPRAATCSEGGTIQPECRSDGNGVVLQAELRGCRLRVDGHNILGATGQLVLTLPIDGACHRQSGSVCGPVTIRAVRTVGTLTDQLGKILAAVDLSELPQPRTVVVPCPNGSSAQPGS